MSSFEVFIVILTSGVFLGILAIFYRLGRAHEFLESKFKSNDEKFTKIEDRFTKLEHKIDDVKNHVIDIDKRLYAVETLLHMKDCCILKQDQNLKKVE